MSSTGHRTDVGHYRSNVRHDRLAQEMVEWGPCQLDLSGVALKLGIVDR